MVAPVDPTVPQIWVDARAGSDAAGDGSADRPFQTLVKAFAVRGRMEEAWVEVRLHVGSHARAAGEAVPILMPSGVRLVGHGTGSTELVGIAEAPVVVLPPDGRVAIESVSVRGGSVGIAASGKSGTLALDLVDVAVSEVGVALDLTPAKGSLAVRIDGLRTRATQIGLHADAGAALDLVIARSTFAGGEEGLVLDDGRAAGGAPERHVALRDCEFVESSGAGCVRRGALGREGDGAPWTFDRCAFRGARIGLLLEPPSGDLPVLVRDSSFRENLSVGLSLVGSGTPLSGSSRIERCEFRWNGVGAQLFAVGREVALDHCTFEDSIGNGLAVGALVQGSMRVAATHCLFACNGGAGLFASCEPPAVLALALERCTAVDNRGSGFELRQRKPGTVAVHLARSIAVGNGVDVAKFDASMLEACHVGGDPGFVDRARRDWRLEPSTAAQDASGPFGALPIAPTTAPPAAPAGGR